MELRIWINENGLTIGQAAGLLGVHRVTMHEYLAGTIMPRPRMLETIRTVTDGKVLAADILAARKA